MEETGFAKCLSDYMERFGCSAAQLSALSGLSASLISRYLRGLRKPAADSEQLTKLAEGLARSEQADPDPETVNEIRRELVRSLTGLDIDYSMFLDNLKAVIDTLGISNITLAKALNYDPSYVSRLLRNERHPADLPVFIDECAEWISVHCDQPGDCELLGSVLETDSAQLTAPDARREALISYLSSHTASDAAPAMHEFLSVLDAFDFDAFAKEIGFDTLKIPNVPFTRHNARYYEGIDEIKEADIDWIKATVLGRSVDDVIMFSDMPISEMGEDDTFVKQYSFGLAAAIKKGLTLHMIHDVHRPMDEMLIGLKNYIPMYMTGQIKPYYFPSVTGAPFHHLLKVSGNAALEGTVIQGHHKDARYYMTRKPGEVQHYQKKAQALLHHAKPLMHIYRENEEDKLKAYLENPAHQKGELFTTDYGHSHITLRKGNFALVSKDKSPTIHFVIKLPQMVRAFEVLFD